MNCRILLLVTSLFFAACNGQDGLQKQLTEALGLKGPKKTGTQLLPSKEDKTALSNSIQGCPKDSSLAGRAFPRGNMQYCAYKDEKGLEIKHGEFRRWYSNGKFEAKGQFQDGEIEGLYQTFYETGQIKDQCNYLHGQANGLKTTYSKEGKKLSVETFKSGFKEGLSVKYGRNETILEKGSYSGDLKNGLWELFNKNGVLREKAEFSQDVRHGKNIKYNKKGALLSQGFYSHDKELGHWIYFNNQGLKKTEGNYVDGKKHGRWVDYGRNGEEVRNTFFDYGRKLDSVTVKQNSGAGGQTQGFGKGDIFGEEPIIRPRTNNYERPRQESNRPKPLEKEGWNPL